MTGDPEIHDQWTRGLAADLYLLAGGLVGRGVLPLLADLAIAGVDPRVRSGGHPI